MCYKCYKQHLIPVKGGKKIKEKKNYCGVKYTVNIIGVMLKWKKNNKRTSVIIIKHI